MADKHIFAGGVFAELGTSDADNQGRALANLGKLFYDSDGFLYKLCTNGDAATRVLHAPTVLDVSTTTLVAETCNQPTTALMHNFAGVWDAAVASSAETDGTDRQFVKYRGVALACPLESGTAHATGALATAFVAPRTGQDEFAQAIPTAANLSDVHNTRVAWLVGADIGTGVSTIDVLLALSAQ